MLELNYVTNQMDQTDIYRTFHPNTKEYTFLAAHGMFPQINHTKQVSTDTSKMMSKWLSPT